MTYEARSGFSGLTTNVAETKAQPSALRVADNVVIRQPGAVEPRQGFEPYETEYPLTATDLTQGEAHGQGMVFETNGNWRAADGTVRQVTLLPLYPQVSENIQKYRADSFSTALARGNMYVPHLRGVVVAPNADATVWRNAGLAQNFWSSGGSAVNDVTPPLGLAPLSKWGYRFVAKKTDENGLIVRSAPTGAFVISNVDPTDNKDVYVGADVFGSSSWESNPDSIEIYRTRTFLQANAIDDEYALVATMEVNSLGRIISPSGEFIDTTPDEQRGAALYTSPSREGFEGKNDPPPACGVVEPYRGFLFFGDCAGPQRLIVSHSLKNCTGLGDGVGWRVHAATVTLGSPTITVLNTVGLQRGMVRVAAGAIHEGYITAIVGLTITMSKNQTYGTDVGNVTFSDAICVDGLWEPLAPNDYGHEMISQQTFEALLHNESDGKFSGAQLTPALAGYTHSHIIEHTIRNDGAFPLLGTHGNEMSPILPLYEQDPAMSEVDVYPNMLMWSKQDEPEHVPPTNYVLIGDKTKRILALCHTRDALFIFKEDGVWRLTGYAGQWSIDPFDMTLFCLLPSSVRRLNNRIYLLSNQGVVIVSDDGVEPVSFPIADQTRKLVDDVRSNFAADGYYHLTGINGVAASVDDRNSEYVLLLGDAALELNGAQALVYNDISRAWTTFSFTTTGVNGFDPQALALAPDNTPLILHNGGVKKSSYAVETTLGQSTRRMYDGAETVVAVNVATAGGVVTIGSANALIAGRDVLVDTDGIAFDIESVTSTTVFTVVLAADMDPPALGYGAIRRGFLCTVQPHGFLGSPQVGKHWNDLEIGFSRLLGPVRMTAQFSSAQPLLLEADQVVDQDFEFYRVDGIAPFHLGTLAVIKTVPVDHARAWLLRVRLMWLAVQGVISLELIQLDARTLAPTKPQQSSSGIA